MSHTYDMIVIGGGPAGYTAALYAARGGLDTLIIERMSVGGQMTQTGDIDNYPGFDEGIDGFTLGMKMQAGAERFGAKTAYCEVTALDLTGDVKHISTTGGDMLTRTVVIATGADARKLGLDGETEMTGRGVHYCAHCDGRFYKGKTIAVIGGGNTAVGDALYLARLAEKVYLVHRRDTFRADRVFTNALKGAENIIPFYNRVPTSLAIEKDSIKGLCIKDTQTGESETLPLDGVFVSIGRNPATSLLCGNIALDESGYILADESTRTNIPGVFAVGDVRKKPLRQIVTAVSDGAVAAHFAEEYLNEHKFL